MRKTGKCSSRALVATPAPMAGRWLEWHKCNEGSLRSRPLLEVAIECASAQGLVARWKARLALQRGLSSPGIFLSTSCCAASMQSLAASPTEICHSDTRCAVAKYAASAINRAYSRRGSHRLEHSADAARSCLRLSGTAARLLPVSHRGCRRLFGSCGSRQRAPLPACAHPHEPNRRVAAGLRTEIQRLSTMPTRKPTPSAMPSEEKGFCLTASSTALSASPAVSCTRSS
jgi:hypothetical protein